MYEFAHDFMNDSGTFVATIAITATTLGITIITYLIRKDEKR